LLVGSGGALISGSKTQLSDINASGSGTAAATIVGGNWTSKGQLIIGDTGSGALSIGMGGTIDAGSNTVDIANQSTGNGTVFVGVAGAELKGGSLFIAGPSGSTGALTVSAGGTVAVTGLTIGTGGAIHMADGNLSASGLSQNNGVIDGFGTLIAGFNNAGTLTASGGRLVVTGSIAGTGSIDIGGGSTLEVDSGVGDSQSVTFVNSATAEALQLNLLLSNTQNFGLSDWQNGDELFIANGVTVTGANWLGGTGTLEVHTTGATYDFTNVTLAAGTTPIFTTGANFVELVSCFAEGTRIATERGEVAVEDLREGDRVQVLGHRAQPIVWVARRWIDCTQQPDPRKVWPVRIAPGAFGPGRPCRELWLSADHAVYIGDVLIPVKYLVNGTSIAQVPVDTVTYFHVELPRHAVLLAEGLTVESYLDTGDRSNFANGGGPIALYPDFASRAWDAEGCAPLVVTGPELDAAKRWVNGLAGRIAPAASAA
jgi:hypothetical protein